MTKQLLVSS